MTAQLEKTNCAQLRGRKPLDSAQFGLVTFLRKVLVNCAEHPEKPRSLKTQPRTLRSEGPPTKFPAKAGNMSG